MPRPTWLFILSLWSILFRKELAYFWTQIGVAHGATLGLELQFIESVAPSPNYTGSWHHRFSLKSCAKERNNTLEVLLCSGKMGKKVPLELNFGFQGLGHPDQHPGLASVMPQLFSVIRTDLDFDTNAYATPALQQLIQFSHTARP